MPDTMAKFEARQDRSGGPDACWPWTGGCGQRGGPRLWWGGTGRQARVLLWELLQGPVPPRRTVTVTCKNPKCMNPKHHALRAIHDDEARFWENVQKGDGCWLWTGSVSVARRGYGVFQFADHSTAPAHRYSYELHNGPIGDSSLFVCHRCDNPPCVRPDHLFLGTAKENNQDMWNKGRGSRGEKHAAIMREVRRREAERASTQAKNGGEK